jgi:hypothetical protein
LQALPRWQQAPTLQYQLFLGTDHLQQGKRKTTHFALNPIITLMLHKSVTCPAFTLLR